MKSSTSNKTVILSAAPNRFILRYGTCGAESKDLGGAYLTHAVWSFRPPKPENRTCRGYAFDHAYIFSCTLSIFHTHVCSRRTKQVPGLPRGRPWPVRSSGLRWVENS